MNKFISIIKKKMIIGLILGVFIAILILTLTVAFTHQSHAFKPAPLLSSQ